MSSEDQPTSQTEDQQLEGEVLSSDAVVESDVEPAEVASEAGDESVIEQLQKQLQDAQAKADDNWSQVLLARADLSNVQRRAERDLENAHKFGMENIVSELLPVLDSLELGYVAADTDEPDPVKVKEGIDLTLKMLVDVASKLGVEQVDPTGEAFNPEFHQAMSTQPTDEMPANHVMTVYQKGYLLNSRLLRPAMVVVSATSNKSTDENNQKVDETA